MSRPRTTKTRLKSRRKAGGKKARLIALARRGGIILGIVMAILWLGAWIWLSDTPQKIAHATQQKAYDVSAHYGFAVRDILVEGRNNTNPDILKALIDVESGDPILAFNPRETKELIERLSWVKEAHVERRLPGTLFIGLMERVPLALWQHQKKVRLIDAEGTILDADNIEKFSDLILLVGARAPERAESLIALLAAEPPLKERIEAASWVGERRWDLTLKSGAVVQLPEDDLGLALRRLALAQEQDGLLDQNLKVIDVREPGRIVIRTKPGAVKEYKASVIESNI